MSSLADAVYDVDADEMTLGQLAVLREVRDQLAEHFATDPDLATQITSVIDTYAAQVAADSDPDWE